MDGVLGPSSGDPSVPIEHLDYGYITKCQNLPELEKILKVLRSGKEGLYPDLITFTEKHIEKLNPSSKVLRKTQRIKKIRDLDVAERDELQDDLQVWMSQMSSADESLKSTTVHNGVDLEENGKLPPVRSAQQLNIKGQEEPKPLETKSGQKKKEKKKHAPRDYREWDKFDVDKVLEEVDKEESVSQDKTVLNTAIPNVPITENISKSKFGVHEAEWKANQEKDKGNEAFRAGDYQEALVYYNRSLKLHPTAAVYNNRAMVEIKLDKFSDALEDCNRVIKQEPDNLKAHLRRATCLKHQGRYSDARQDLEVVFRNEPTNKRGKDLLAEIEKAESVSTQSTSTEMNPEASPFEKKKRKGQRLKIVEVDSDDTGEQINGNKQLVEEKIVSHRNEENLDTNAVCDVHKNTNMNGHENEMNNKNIEAEFSNSGIMNEEIAGTEQKQPSNEEHYTPHVSSSLVEVPSSTSPTQPPPLPDEVVRLKDYAADIYQKGQYDKAVETYTKAINILCEEKSKYKMYLAPLLSNRAAAYSRIGECKFCISDCTQALEINPNSYKTQLRRAQAHETLEKFKDAYRDFQAVLRVDPQNKTATEGSSRCMKILKDVHGTKWRDVVNTVTIEPSVPQDDQQPFLSKKEEVRTAHSEADTAEVAPTSSVKQSKEERFKVLKEKGNASFSKGKNEDAISYYTQCIKLCPDQLSCYTNRALCFLKLKKFQEALEDTISALKLDSQNVKALYRRALAYKGLEKYAEALTTLKTTLMIDPSNTAAKKELSVVQELLNKAKKQKKSEKAPLKPSPPKPSSNPPTQKRKVLIEEVDDSDSEDEENRPSEMTTKPKDEVTKRETASGDVHRSNVQKEASPVKPINHVVSQDVNGNKERKPPVIESTKMVKGFEFLQMWNSLKGASISSYANLLRRVELSKLHSVITNKLDGDMLGLIFKAITEEFIPRGEIQPSLDILRSLHKAQRFDIVMMFLSDKEKRGIKGMFDELLSRVTKEEEKNLLALKKKYV